MSEPQETEILGPDGGAARRQVQTEGQTCVRCGKDGKFVGGNFGGGATCSKCGYGSSPEGGIL